MATIHQVKLHVPDLKELAEVLNNGLTAFYKNVSVTVAVPTIEELQSWGLTSGGFGGGITPDARYGAILDVGGVHNVHFMDNHDKYHWDIHQLSKQVGLPDGFFLGAGASTACCELIPNTVVGQNAKCGTYTAAVHPETGKCVLKKNEVDPSYRSLVNLYGSQGKAIETLKVDVSHALNTKQSLVSAMRTVIRGKYTAEQNVALGGAFRVVNGAIKSHIMPGYSTCDLFTMDQVESWLKFYQPIQAPLTCCSVQIAWDIPEWELRCEHTHFFGETEGGHYHYDVTPDNIHYLGYFAPAEVLFRIDQSQPPLGKQAH